MKLNQNIPKEPDKYLDYKIGRLKFLCDDFSDEILDTIIHSDYNDVIYGNRFKIRNGWFATIKFELFPLVEQGYIPEDIFLKRKKIENSKSKITSKEDISSANEFLLMLINYIGDIKDRNKKEVISKIKKD